MRMSSNGAHLRIPGSRRGLRRRGRGEGPPAAREEQPKQQRYSSEAALGLGGSRKQAEPRCRPHITLQSQSEARTFGVTYAYSSSMSSSLRPTVPPPCSTRHNDPKVETFGVTYAYSSSMSSSFWPVARRRALTAAQMKSLTATPGTSTGAWKLGPIGGGSITDSDYK